MSGIKGNVSWCIWKIRGAVLSLLSVETQTTVVVFLLLFICLLFIRLEGKPGVSNFFFFA